MNLPFTADQFLEVFKTYNLSVWPAQYLLVILALLLIFLSIKKNKFSDRIITIGLAFYWFWMGIVYHLIFFSKINPAANVFAILYIIQGILFIYYGLFTKELVYINKNDAYGITSILFFLYALLFYPLLGYYFGHIYPSTPTFGLPCPTTILTLGFLLLLEKKNIGIHIIPLIWAVIGFTAAIKLGIYQDIGLLVAGIVTVVLLVLKKN
jgi:hypothetical protein